MRQDVPTRAVLEFVRLYGACAVHMKRPPSSTIPKALVRKGERQYNEIDCRICKPKVGGSNPSPSTSPSSAVHPLRQACTAFGRRPTPPLRREVWPRCAG